jgi:mycothiol synthase
MREVADAEAEKLTFFMYEEIDAFRRAAESEGLSASDVEDVFYNNAGALLAEAGAERKPRQLCMAWPADRPASAIEWSLPEGYSLRTYRDGDDEGYVNVMRSAGFDGWSPKSLANVLAKSVPNGISFVIHNASGKIVATACSLHNPNARHPFGGEMGWVAVDPEHRGRRLGYITTAAATRRLLEAGYRNVYLLTDDWREPAIKTYLRLGYVPFLFHPSLERRWRDVCARLGIDFPEAACVRP